MIVSQASGGLGLLAAVLVMALTSGCSAVQSNVRGGFACSAPGGTCAPSTTIDDGALGAMQGTARAERAGATGQQAPGNVDLVLGEAPPADDGAIVGQRRSVAGGAAGQGGPSAPASGHALRIVYPAYRTRDGAIHPRHLAYALVDTASWTGALRGRGHLAGDGNQPRPGEGLLGAALNAPPLGGLPVDRDESSSPAIPLAVTVEGQGPAAGTGVGVAPASLPSAKPASPTAQIEAEVSALLAKRKAVSAGTFSGKVE